MSAITKGDKRAVLRAELAKFDDDQQPIGKIAQLFRNFAGYRKAQSLFIAPTPLLAQLRMNALADGKKLVVPGPGMREGFFLFRPYSVPFGKMPMAVSMRGLPEYGTRLTSEEVGDLNIELLITDTLAVDREGTMIGDGKGYFDLAVAVLRELGGLSSDVETVAIPQHHGILDELLPRDPWDVTADMVIGIEGVIPLTTINRQSCRQASIQWDRLESRRIKKINPLWYLYQKNKGLKA